MIIEHFESVTAFSVDLNLQLTAHQPRSIVATAAISLSGLGVAAVNNFISYELIMGLMRSLYRKGTISKREYEKVQKIMLKKYRPAAGKTYSDLQ